LFRHNTHLLSIPGHLTPLNAASMKPVGIGDYFSKPILGSPIPKGIC